MTLNQLEKIFEKYRHEDCEFENILDPKHIRPDICAMLMFDEIQTRNDSQRQAGMISGAVHDKVYFDVNVGEFSEVVLKNELIDLIRCGVFLEEGRFAMFV